MITKLPIITALLICSCTSNQSEHIKPLETVENTDSLNTPESWHRLDVDSMVTVHHDNLLFMNYWSGMTPGEFDAVTDRNLKEGTIRNGQIKKTSRSYTTGTYNSDLLVTYEILDSVELELNMFYLAPIAYEKDYVSGKNYRAERDLRESPNGAIVLFDGNRNFQYVDSLIRLKFQGEKTFDVEVRSMYCSYFLDDSVYLGATMYSLEERNVPGMFPTLIVRSKSDGEYLKKNANNPPGGI